MLKLYSIYQPLINLILILKFRPIIPYAALEERSIQKYRIVMKRSSLETEKYAEEISRTTNQTTRNILSAASNFISTINEFDKPNTESSSNYDDISSMTKASVHSSTI